MGLCEMTTKMLAILLAIFVWPGPGSWLLLTSGAGIGNTGIRTEDVNLVLPSIIKQGDDLTMYCYFDSNKFPQIYSVKWYKGRREFFRFTPKEIPAKKSMGFGGMDVDAAQCDLQKVHLRKIPIQMAGNITCEVTTDNDFRAVVKTKSLTVIIESETPPVLNVFPDSTTVRLQSKLKVLCTSGPSKPAANISFFINDVPYSNPTYFSFDPQLAQTPALQSSKFYKNQPQDFRPNESNGGGVGGGGGGGGGNGESGMGTGILNGGDKDKGSLGLEIRKAEIQINLTQKDFVDGKFRIKCAATISHVNVSQMYSEPFTGELFVPPKEVVYSSYGITNGGNVLSPAFGLGKLVWSITETTTPITTTMMRTCVSFGKLLLFFPLNILLHQSQQQLLLLLH